MSLFFYKSEENSDMQKEEHVVKADNNAINIETDNQNIEKRDPQDSIKKEPNLYNENSNNDEEDDLII